MLFPNVFCTLHRVPYIVYPKSCTLHRVPYIVYPTSCTLHRGLHISWCNVQSVSCKHLRCNRRSSVFLMTSVEVKRCSLLTLQQGLHLHLDTLWPQKPTSKNFSAVFIYSTNKFPNRINRQFAKLCSNFF